MLIFFYATTDFDNDSPEVRIVAMLIGIIPSVQQCFCAVFGLDGGTLFTATAAAGWRWARQLDLRQTQ
jgi:hypothetical protein